MADADCRICEALGYRTCDICGGVAYERGALGVDVCGYCREELAAAGRTGAAGPPRGAAPGCPAA